ncbi:zinc-ribbon domain-containing protein [Ruminococcus sp. YE71]|uniref:zinc ribbon domain-containing protein n=1 Tax=unclassified Ruminococcus TaxID=2608920 RepID=UPI00087EEC06|nr:MULTISPECIES: zinc ribbon domain-containing protein [unclassified Ruminococcus]SDA24835.1 zinc-ribbon domain-containing protein [Ruminococcus sp. YE78]SFW43410.1 zinc-ribbon domain-containing protein [Ruminococcus sp. YE71]
MAGFCAKCGSRIDDNIRFCAKCGTRVESAPQVMNVQQVQPQTYQFEQPQQDLYYQPAPQPSQQTSEKKGMSNVAAFFLAIVVLAVGTTGFFAFKEDGFLRRDSEETSKSRSSKEKSSKAEKSDKEKSEEENDDTPKAEKKDTANNTVDWDGTIYGVELPKPDGYDKVYEIVDNGDTTGVYIDGVTYDEYKAYCKSIEDSPDWVPADKTPPEDTAHFPDDYNEKVIAVYFSGTYKDSLYVSVHYCVDSFCEDTGKPNFEIVAYLK